MKRRAVLAGLLVAAIAAMALMLVRSEGTHRLEAGAIKGQPWTGSEGRSVSVAKLASASSEVRPVTAPEQDEEAADEGEQASAETVGPDVREKPEPGEESGPPKHAGPAVPAERTGEDAITPSQAVTAGTSFLGARLSESNFVPPDSMGAVGPSQVLVSVNGRIKVFDKNGSLGGLNLTDSQFWAPVRNGAEPTDPGVEYDRLSGRWIVSAINIENTNNRVMLAVSDGPTITSASDFTFYFFNESTPPPAGPARFADYPQLGVDANAIYVGVNEFTSSSGTFTGTSAFVIRKSSVINGGPIVVTAFRNLVASPGGPGPESPQPATDMNPGVGAGYIVGPDRQLLNRIDVRRITNPGGAPSISGNLGVTVPNTAQPLSVPASGTSGGLDALDDRLFEAMIGTDPNGLVSLWTAHNIRMNAAGNGSGSGNRDGARWYQIGSLDSSPSLTQSGSVFDTAVSNPNFYWMPSIAQNGQGHASINMSRAGPGQFAQIASSGRLFDDPAGTTEAPTVTQTSTSSYNVGSEAPRRWGDYSQTVVDPSDNMTFWTFQEYANANNSWGVRVIQLKSPPPATPSAAEPVPAGSCSVRTEVTGTSTDGSGFFDPGADFPSHIGAAVSGGVAVNNVTYEDPTHVELDLDTRGAATGTEDVTITNPDGQEETTTDLLTIDPAGTGPTPPCLSGTSPDSPSNDPSPEILGAAEPGSTVNLYTDPGCPPGEEVGTGTADDFAFPGITVTPPLSANSTTVFYATATVGPDVSACSSTLATPSGSVTYVEDETPPDVSIDGGPSGLTNDSTPSFTFSATDSAEPVTFQCSIDTGVENFGPCSGPGDSDTPGAPLANGPYTFRVQGTDAAGNTATVTRSFEVDSTPPSVTIDSGPTGTIPEASPTFTYSGTDAHGPVSFLCSIDSGTSSFGPCSGPGNADTPSSPLADGAYVFRVRGADAAGNSAVATRSFAVQVPKPVQPVAPDTKITKGPKKTRKTRPKFKFSSSDPAATFQCRLDKGRFAACTSPFRTPKLRPGKHKLQVQAVGAGGSDATPAVKKFRVLPPK
jgi:Bacterial Ig-like domain